MVAWRPTNETNLQEWLASFPNLLTGILVDILLADVCAPLLDDLFIKYVGLVKRHKDLRYSRDKVGVGDTNETLDTPEQRLLMLLGSDQLEVDSMSRIPTSKRRSN